MSSSEPKEAAAPTSASRRQRSAALTAAALFALSLVLGVAAAACFTLPNLIGFSGQNVLTEPDFWCVAGSSLCALAAAAVSLRYAFAGDRPSRGALLGGTLGGAGLAFLLFLLWAEFVMFYALLLAPAHALAAIGVTLVIRRHRRDAAMRRFAAEAGT
jgi:hypothetical protein